MISLSVTKDGDRRIGLSYHPPHVAQPAASAIVATQDEALAALEDLVTRMLAHQADGFGGARYREQGPTVDCWGTANSSTGC